MKVKDIVVVGGGSAGWMTAAILIKSFPEKNIKVIESPDILKIGVGESTFQGINDYLEYLEINREDFFTKTNASIKLAIQFRNFYREDGEPDFIYPFGSPDFDGTKWGLTDWFIKKYLKKETPITDFAESYFASAHMVKHNSLSDNKYGEFSSFDPILDTALHFDAIKFAEWLKDNYAVPRGVRVIYDNVKNIVVDKDGIKKLILEGGGEIHSDLFIDCTGFKSILLSGAMNEQFISYNDVLPNTHAWATQVDYKNPKIEIENITRSTALKNGWCWNIPLWSRLGSGYVYSEKYIDHDSALKEFKEYILNDMKIKRSLDDVEELNFKNIEMRVGIHKNVWVKNVVAIGLSAGFIEPLESNGLFTVHEFLFELIRGLQREEITQWDRDIFNYSVKVKFDQFVEFIRIHYALSIRKDSEYWLENSKRSYDFNESRMKDFRSSHLYQIQNIKVNNENLVNGGITWISAGMNYPLLDDISIKLSSISNKINYKEEMKRFFYNIDSKKNIWSENAKKSEKTYDYLKRKYYGGKND